MTGRDWKHVETELNNLRPGALEPKKSAAPKSPPAAGREDDAVLKHIAEALRLD